MIQLPPWLLVLVALSLIVAMLVLFAVPAGAFALFGGGESVAVVAAAVVAAGLLTQVLPS